MTDTYNGSAPFHEFFTQFNLIARANPWEEETKTAVLLTYSLGKAHTILESMHIKFRKSTIRRVKEILIETRNAFRETTIVTKLFCNS